MQSKITQALVERAPTPERGRSTLHADPEMRGFYLVVTPTKRSFYVQSSVNGRQVRTKIGDHPSLTAKDARALAAKTLVSMRAGKNPNEERRRARNRGITLKDALELHLSSKKLAELTVKDYRYHVDQYLADWLDRPLADIGRDRTAVRDRHIKISKQCGHTTADGTFRVFRALYNRALRASPELPPNPSSNVDFHGMKRRKVDVDAAKLRRWGTAVLGLNPVRRDLHLFMLLTGMRRTATLTAMRVHSNAAGDVLRVVKPKGGEGRAFDLPLSKPLQDLVTHRIAENARDHRKSPWIWPSHSESGHVQELTQSELEGLTGHALRHCFGTLAVESGVPLLELQYLLNHKVNSVTGGYLHLSVDHLRVHQERASASILGKVGLTWTPGTWPPTASDAT